jgi:hypothetical protein
VAKKVKIMGYAKDSDGRWHNYYDQAKGSSCGPACVRIVAKMVTGKEFGEEMVRQMIEREEGGVVSTLTSESGGLGGAGSHDWGNHGGHGSGGGGVGTWNLDNVLKSLGITDAHVEQGYPRNAFNKTSVKNPGIAACGWSAGWNGSNSQGLHWVVVAGTLSNGNYLIIDPAFGIGEVSPNDAVLQYNPGTPATFLNNRTIITARE